MPAYWAANLDFFVRVGTLETDADTGANVDPWSGTCGSDSVSRRQFRKARTFLDFLKVRAVFVPSLLIDR
jgi:hypothetical protein